MRRFLWALLAATALASTTGCFQSKSYVFLARPGDLSKEQVEDLLVPRREQMTEEAGTITLGSCRWWLPLIYSMHGESFLRHVVVAPPKREGEQGKPESIWWIEGLEQRGVGPLGLLYSEVADARFDLEGHNFVFVRAQSTLLAGDRRLTWDYGRSWENTYGMVGGLLWYASKTSEDEGAVLSATTLVALGALWMDSAKDDNAHGTRKRTAGILWSGFGFGVSETRDEIRRTVRLLWIPIPIPGGTTVKAAPAGA